MKRKVFVITNVRTGETARKSTFNAANRQVETMVRDIAKFLGQTFVLAEINSEKEGFDMVRGKRVWTNEDGTDSFVFTIEKLA